MVRPSLCSQHLSLCKRCRCEQTGSVARWIYTARIVQSSWSDVHGFRRTKQGRGLRVTVLKMLLNPRSALFEMYAVASVKVGQKVGVPFVVYPNTMILNMHWNRRT